METKPNIELAKKLLENPSFPRSAKYDPEWLVSLDMGCPTFWLLERLCEVIDLQPGMRVLDLGCGKAGGPIFLANEYDLQVWAVDLWVDQNENWKLIRESLNLKSSPCVQRQESYHFLTISLMQYLL
jgi:hypothetical protein